MKSNFYLKGLWSIFCLGISLYTSSCNKTSIKSNLDFFLVGEKQNVSDSRGLRSENLTSSFLIQEIYLDSQEVFLAENQNYQDINNDQYFQVISNKIEIDEAVKAIQFTLKDENNELISPEFYTLSYEYLTDQSALIPQNSLLVQKLVDAYRITIRLINGIEKTFTVAQQLNIVLEVEDFGNLTLLNPTTIEEDNFTLKFADNSYGVSNNSIDTAILIQELKLNVAGFSTEEFEVEFINRREMTYLIITLDGRKWGKVYATEIVSNP